MSVIGEDGRPSVMSRGGQGDHPTAVTALAAILAALRQRDRASKAQFFDVSLQNTGVWTLGADIQQQLAGLPERPQQDRKIHGVVTWNSYRTGDDRWIMLVMNDPPRYWNSFARCVRWDDLVDDPRYVTTDQLLQHGPALIAELDAIFASHDLAYWSAQLDEHGCLWSLAATIAEVIEDPQHNEYDALSQPWSAKTARPTEPLERPSRSLVRRFVRAVRHLRSVNIPARYWRNMDSRTMKSQLWPRAGSSASRR